MTDGPWPHASFADEDAHGARIKVVGVGGGGGNAVNPHDRAGLHGVEFIAVNTDLQALRANLSPVKVQLGEKITKGLGAGANPAVGRQSAEEDTETILRRPRRARTWCSSPPAWAVAPAPAARRSWRDARQLAARWQRAHRRPW